MITDIGIELGRALYWSLSAEHPHVRAERQHLLPLSLLVFLFFAGGTAGALLFPVIGFRLMLPLAVLLAAPTVLPIAADLHSV